jgi:hypothetical protein
MSSDLLLLVNEPVGRWRDEIEASLDDIIAWVNRLANQSIEESKNKKEKCEICNSIEGLELDHISGRKHDYRTATLCYDCHQWHSKKQRAYGKEWEQKDQPENMRQAFFLKGLIDLLELKAIRTGNSNYRTLAENYTETIHSLQR